MFDHTVYSTCASNSGLNWLLSVGRTLDVQTFWYFAHVNSSDIFSIWPKSGRRYRMSTKWSWGHSRTEFHCQSPNLSVRKKLILMRMRLENLTKNYILMICWDVLTSIVMILQPNGTKDGIANFTDPHNQFDIKQIFWMPS